MSSRRETVRTPEFSADEWQARFERYLASKHCSLFGRAMPTALPDERERAAAWYVEVIMAVANGTSGK